MMDTVASRSDVQRAMREFIDVSTVRGSALFLSDLLLYLAAIIGVVYLPGWILKLTAGCFAGVKLVNMLTLGHDAAHGSLVRSPKLNKAIAIACFTPELINYALWIYDHHWLHHRRTNETHPDSYTPLSKEQYDAQSVWGRFKYRFYRTPNPFAFGLYYMFERWWQAKFFPRSRMPAEIRSSGWRYFAWLCIYLISYLGLLAAVPSFAPVTRAQAIVCAFIVPVYVCYAFFAFSLYVQHTHPRVPWFKQPPDRNTYGRQEYTSVHVIFPRWYEVLAHNAYHHIAHHVGPAVPSYRLDKAQGRLNQLMAERVVSEPFSVSWLSRVMAICRLYDYDNHRWLDYDGSVIADVQWGDSDTRELLAEASAA
jgi:omega-6 fatty acid desaturase (delta-12 desaturase)